MTPKSEVLESRATIVEPHGYRLQGRSAATLDRPDKGRVSERTVSRTRKPDCDVVVVGAGPYGLSAAAHLRGKGLDVRVFGEPMQFWSQQMPEGMLLRSPWAASNLSDPGGKFSLDAFRDQSGGDVGVPIPCDRFVEYGRWFQRHAAGEVDRRRVVDVAPVENQFRLTLSDGESLTSERVVVASGIGPFARRPEVFGNLPRALATHTSDQRDVSRFRDKRVMVVGAGQSALESAALIHEAGGSVEVVARTPAFHWLGMRERIQRRLGPLAGLLYSPYDIGPAGVSRIVAVPDTVKFFPRSTQTWFRTRALHPAGARWLIDRTANVTLTPGRSIAMACAVGDGVDLRLDDGSVRRVDHVVLGTGYRVDVSRYAFLSADTCRTLEMRDGFPLLRRGFESSIRGLHFLGAPSAWRYGPLMYFVAGTDYAARHVAVNVARAMSPRAR